MDWIAYYDDGSSFTSEQGGPGDAPGLGVVCVAIADESIGRAVIHGWDFYVWHEPGGWDAHNLHGLLDQLTMRPSNVSAVMQGRMVPRIEYERIVRLAQYEDDSGLPVRSARREGEGAKDAPPGSEAR
jgi:hypothetical protein